jgi:demethylmenaquinone methyltransferase/2-methoxy-6-polyprenyl-1,4-benzoquinol methylase
MANKFFEPGPRRAAKVQDLFQVVAPRYDLINDLQSFGLHRYWKRRLFRLAAPQPGSEVLDVCCGTGDVALAFARRGTQVTGVDFSRSMLDIARQRAHAAQLSINWLQADALHLPALEASFDVVTISYGLRNLADTGLGLKEMERVVKPGGKLLVLDFGKPRLGLIRVAYFSYLRMAVPLLGKVVCGEPAAYSYILESLRHYPAQKGVASLMRQLGFEQVRIHNFLGGMMSVNYGEKSSVEDSS